MPCIISIGSHNNKTPVQPKQRAEHYKQTDQQSKQAKRSHPNLSLICTRCRGPKTTSILCSELHHQSSSTDPGNS